MPAPGCTPFPGEWGRMASTPNDQRMDGTASPAAIPERKRGVARGSKERMEGQRDAWSCLPLWEHPKSHRCITNHLPRHPHGYCPHSILAKWGSHLAIPPGCWGRSFPVPQPHPWSGHSAAAQALTPAKRPEPEPQTTGSLLQLWTPPQNIYAGESEKRSAKAWWGKINK